MKTKFVRNTKTDRRELVMAVQRGERLDEKRAKVLAADPSTLLLPFEYEISRVGVFLRYDVEGLWSLKTFLAKRQLGVDELLGLFQATLGVLDICAEQRLKSEGLYFDPEFVFVNAQCCPHFVLLTLEEMPLQERNSPLALLKALSDVNRLHFSSPDAEGIARRLAAYIVEQGGVFSANTFRRFLEGEEQALGLGEAEDEMAGAVPAAQAGSTWATAGTGTTGSAANDGSLFWNPLMGLSDESEPAVAVAPAAASVPVSAPSPAATPAVVATSVSAPAAEARVELGGQTPQAETVVVPVGGGTTVAPQVSQTAWLVRVATGEQYPLQLGIQLKLGRGSGCDIRLLGNPRLSRVHAAIRCDGMQVQVTDLGAANGVWVNGARLGVNQVMTTSVGQAFRLANEDVYVRVG